MDQNESSVSRFDAYYSELQQGKRRKKRTNAVPLVAAFLTGAIVIGGFAYTADRNSLLRNGARESAQAVKGNVASQSAQQDAGIENVSFQGSSDIADIYEQASPAVVKIDSYKGRQLDSSGTGFFFDKDGYLLTNEHVIAGASTIQVSVQGYDNPLTAEVLGTSKQLDLAVLKVSNPTQAEFPALTLGSSDELKIGDWVVAIGNPDGLDQSLTLGVLSAKERPITVGDERGGSQTLEHLLQTDAAINPGNSGGPLLNSKGEVIGINTAVNAKAQGIGFAIPSSMVKDVLDQWKPKQL